MSFHLKREAKRTLYVKWNNTNLENKPHPKYLVVTLDRTLSYKEHIHNTKMNVLMKQLSNSKWDCNAMTIRTTGWAMFTPRLNTPSLVRSPDASKLDHELNDACRSITGCLKQTNVEEICRLAGIAPPDIRRYVCARVERRNRKQTQPTINTARFQQRDA